MYFVHLNLKLKQLLTYGLLFSYLLLMIYESYVLHSNVPLPKSIISNTYGFTLLINNKNVIFPIKAYKTRERALQATMRCWRKILSQNSEMIQVQDVKRSEIDIESQICSKSNLELRSDEGKMSSYNIDILQLSLLKRLDICKLMNITTHICDYRYNMNVKEVDVENTIFPELSRLMTEPIQWYIQRDNLYNTRYNGYLRDMLEFCRISGIDVYHKKSNAEKLLCIQRFYHLHIITSVYVSQWGVSTLHYSKLSDERKRIIDRKVADTDTSAIIEGSRKHIELGRSQISFQELLIFRRYCEEYSGNYYVLLEEETSIERNKKSKIASRDHHRATAVLPMLPMMTNRKKKRTPPPTSTKKRKAPSSYK